MVVDLLVGLADLVKKFNISSLIACSVCRMGSLWRRSRGRRTRSRRSSIKNRRLNDRRIHRGDVDCIENV